MRKWRRVRLSILWVFLGSFGHAQDIPIGTWRYHLSYQNARLVTGDDEIIFCGTQNGLFSLTQGVVQTLLKTDGLSNVGPGALAYDSETQTLIIGYNNSVLDFVTADGVAVVDDLQGLDFGVPKGINKIVVNDQLVYAATDFGIVSINLVDHQLQQIFAEIGPGGQQLALHDVVIEGDFIYTLSQEGVLVGDLRQNLLDFNNWSLIPSPSLDGLELYRGQVLAFDKWQLYVVNVDSLTLGPLLTSPFGIADADAADDLLYVLGTEALAAWDGEALTAIQTTQLTNGQEIFVAGNTLWIADQDVGLIHQSGNVSEVIVPNGPQKDNISDLKFEKELFAFYSTPPESGSVDSSGYSTFSEGSWSNLEIPGFYNISDVGTINGRTILSSNGFGVWDLDEGTSLDVELPDDVHIPAILTRNDGTWLLPYAQSDALLFLEESGGILRFDSATVGTNRATSLQQSQAGSVWLTRANASGGIYVYNPIEQLRRRITIADDLPSNLVRDIIIDLEDEAWIATSRGPAFFPDASFVFDEFGAISPIFENDLLLEDENITAIAVDGGNRKWIGTNDGVWVFNRDLTAVDFRFRAADSPLLSDGIIAFAYDPEKGEMFILTTMGLCSYQTGSSAGGLTHANVRIFPNPVYPHDVGPVTLKGLAQNAIVKVTDINGRVISQSEALGGTATWDLRTVQGSPVVGGVYLIFSSTANGEDTFVGKVAVIR